MSIISKFSYLHGLVYEHCKMLYGPINIGINEIGLLK